ncbi:hypothetical protein SAMN04488121_1011316 [Chitinophaga filiformis]|uniref:Uncharacterized protein n=1 Tax=Chitinophaga filiformis TaxID=104663 RepID=A0A1G7JNU3_CHIFI|nr:hypothetical protein SAMN04488121_1011316 [Chitinophaga filiformis]
MLAIQGSQRYTVYRIITPLNIQKKRGVLNILVNRNYIRTRDNKSMLLWDFDYPLQKASEIISKNVVPILPFWKWI